MAKYTAKNMFGENVIIIRFLNDKKVIINWWKF